MDRLGWARSWMSQDVARSNAATAARRLTDRRREREAVDAFVAQRLDARGAAPGAGDDRSGLRAALSWVPPRPAAQRSGPRVAAPHQ
jgi:hypothetical protein